MASDDGGNRHGSGKRALGIGCGAAHSSVLIQEAGATVVGADASQGLVDYANTTFDGVDPVGLKPTRPQSRAATSIAGWNVSSTDLEPCDRA